MSLEEIAEIYAKLFVGADDKEEAYNEIISRLSNLKLENGTPISNEIKLKIVEVIKEFLRGKRHFNYADGGVFLIVEAQDNEKFLSLAGNILSQLNSTSDSDE